VFGELLFPKWTQNYYQLSGFWGSFDIPVERERHARTLAAARRYRPGIWDSALEIGCSEGVFTLHLAECCRAVHATDISDVACRRAAERCASYPQVRVERRDLVHDNITLSYDLIFVLDVLEYVFGKDQLAAVAEKLANAVRHSGLLVVSDYELCEERRRHRLTRRFVMDRDSRLEFFIKHPDLHLVHEEYYPEVGRPIPNYLGHIIAVFEKR